MKSRSEFLPAIIETVSVVLYMREREIRLTVTGCLPRNNSRARKLKKNKKKTRDRQTDRQRQRENNRKS